MQTRPQPLLSQGNGPLSWECRLVDLLVKASPSTVEVLGSIPVRAVDLFPGGVLPVTEILVLNWLPC